MTTKPFLMTIFDVKPLAKQKNSCEFLGIIQQGNVARNNQIQLVNLQYTKTEALVKSVTIVESQREDRVRITALLENNIEPNQFEHGFIISPPDSISIHESFLADVTLLSSNQGGRTAAIPFVIGYAQANAYDVILSIHNLTLLVRPQHPNPSSVDYMELEPSHTATLLFNTSGRHLPLEIGYEFRLQEGPKIVATGVVTKLL